MRVDFAHSSRASRHLLLQAPSLSFIDSACCGSKADDNLMEKLLIVSALESPA